MIFWRFSWNRSIDIHPEDKKNAPLRFLLDLFILEGVPIFFVGKETKNTPWCTRVFPEVWNILFYLKYYQALAATYFTSNVLFLEGKLL